VLDSIRRIVRCLRISSRSAEKEAGLTTAQLFVLSRLASQSAVSLNELAERTLTHQSSASVVVSRLVSRGLVRRSQSPRDARRLELRLTARGQRVLKTAPDTAQDRLIHALNRMKSAERRRLAALMHRFIQLADIDQPAAMFFEDAPATEASRHV
jgi:DNA-binding MarR family transcriptional regulator